jgi:hypothetical protein
MLKTAEGYQSFEEVLEQKVEKMLKADGVLLFVGYYHKPEEGKENATIDWDLIRHQFPQADFPEETQGTRLAGYGGDE